MGTDIHGWVEIRDLERGNWWSGVISVRSFVHRSYGMFASLFGERNMGNEFRPIAAQRGAPEGISDEYAEARVGYGESAEIGETWILWSELAAVDWEEEGQLYLGEDGNVHSYPAPGRRRERRKDYLVGTWALLLEMMALLARDYGAENVRLVVWFD